MKIIEAMKKLRVIEKRIESNRQMIEGYASSVTIEKPLLETNEAQKEEVLSLLQANEDLVKEYLGLKCKIERTNLDTVIEVSGHTMSISELLIMKRKLSKLMIGTYNALNDKEAERKLLRYSRWNNENTEKPGVIRFYDEKKKTTELRKWQDLYESIDSRLEVVNATTDLME